MNSADWHLYILRCGDGTLYTGITNDLDRRVGEHARGRGCRYTRHRGPIRLGYSERIGERAAAMKREAAVKRWPREKKLLLIREAGPTGPARKRPRGKLQPKAQSLKPKTQSQSPVPTAQSRTRRAQNPKLKARSPKPKDQSKKPNAQSKKRRAVDSELSILHGRPAHAGGTAATPAPAYMIAEIAVRDGALYSRYVKQVPRIVQKYGGRYLARAGKTSPVAGDWAPERLIVIEFPSMERARACFDSPEYRSIAPLRENSTAGRAVIVEGIPAESGSGRPAAGR